MSNFLKTVKKQFTHKGRTSRKNYFICVFVYFLFFIPYFFFLTLPVIIDAPIGCNMGIRFLCYYTNYFWHSHFYITILISFILPVIIFFIPILFLGIRRMHDINKSGWHILIPLYSFILTFKKGYTGNNKYGSLQQ